jgi:MFS family permease
MLAALRVRDFRLLWSARLVSSLGTWLLVIAIPAYVYDMTGSLVATGLTLFAEHLPSLLLGPVAGVLSDRFDRRVLMVATDLLRAAAIALLLLARGPDLVWLIYLALAIESTGTMLYRPAAQAYTPVVVGTGTTLNSANSLNAVTDGVVRLVGAPLGAVILTAMGADILIELDVASYLLSATALLVMSRRPRKAPESRTTVRTVFSDLAQGLSYLVRERIALALLLTNTTFLLANASLSALLVPYGMTHLGGSRQTGLVMSALGVGFLLGAPLIKVLLDRVQPKVILIGSLWGTGAGYVALFTSSSLYMAVPAAVVIGVFGSMGLVVPYATLQRVAPNSVLGRVSSVLFTGEAFATLVGSVLGPTVANAAGDITVTALLASALTLVGSAMAALLLPRLPASPERAVTAVQPD